MFGGLYAAFSPSSMLAGSRGGDEQLVPPVTPCKSFHCFQVFLCQRREILIPLSTRHINTSAGKWSIRKLHSVWGPLIFHTVLIKTPLNRWGVTAALDAEWISYSSSTFGYCHNDTWPGEIVCADKRPPSSFCFLYLPLNQRDKCITLSIEHT